MTPTGTNLLGLVKHLAGLEYLYLGESFGYPAPETMSWIEDGSIWEGADMWAKPDESSEYMTGLYRRACAHADGVIAALDLEAPGSVAHLATRTSSGNSSTGRAARTRMTSTNPRGRNTSPRFKPRPTRSSPAPSSNHDLEPLELARNVASSLTAESRAAATRPCPER
jgi:hypothetical protein